MSFFYIIIGILIIIIIIFAFQGYYENGESKSEGNYEKGKPEVPYEIELTLEHKEPNTQKKIDKKNFFGWALSGGIFYGDIKGSKFGSFGISMIGFVIIVGLPAISKTASERLEGIIMFILLILVVAIAALVFGYNEYLEQINQIQYSGLKLCPSCNVFQDATKMKCPNCSHDLMDSAEEKSS